MKPEYSLLYSEDVDTKPYSDSIQSSSHPRHTLMHLASILILSTRILLDLVSGIFASGYPSNWFSQFSSHACYMLSPHHPLPLSVTLVV
jgi:hypothetical protein